MCALSLTKDYVRRHHRTEHHQEITTLLLSSIVSSKNANIEAAPAPHSVTTLVEFVETDVVLDTHVQGMLGTFVVTCGERQIFGHPGRCAGDRSWYERVSEI